MNSRDLIDYFTYFDVLLHPKGGPTVVNPGPKPLVSPYGPGYSMHPELSRSGMVYLIMRVAPYVAVATTIATSHYYETKNIEQIVMSERTPSWWKVLSLSGQ